MGVKTLTQLFRRFLTGAALWVAVLPRVENDAPARGGAVRSTRE